MTAEHSSEEGGERLTTTDERVAIRTAANAMRVGGYGSMYRCVERILADRLSAVQAERDAEVAEADREMDKTLAIMEAACDRADDLKAERDDLRGRLAAVEALADTEGCWTLKTSEPGPFARCANWVGLAEMPNGTKWTEDMCCLPCRIRAALANPSAAQGEGEA